MKEKNYKLYIGSVSAIIIYCAVILIIIFNPSLFNRISNEDGLIEIISALSFLFTSVFFIGFLIRSKEKKPNNFLFSFFTICWILFAFLCFGEEISWGQRICGFELSNDLKVEEYQVIESNFKNIQNETNLHNMGIVEKIGNRVIIAGIQFITGLLLPILILFKRFKKFFNKIHLPIPSIFYSMFIIGGLFLIGTKLFYTPARIDGIYLYDRVNEFSEMMMGLGFLLYSIQCFIYSKNVFK